MFGYHTLYKWVGGGVPSQTMELQEMGVDGQQRDPRQLEDFIRVSREISNSHLVQVYMSKQSGMEHP